MARTRWVAGLAAAGLGAGMLGATPAGADTLVGTSIPAYETYEAGWAATPTQQWTPDNGTVPLVGDFNGDGLDDVYFYGSGTKPDLYWLANDVALDEISPTVRANRFTTKARAVSGSYKPFVGDFNGDGYDDIFWYGPGTAPDSIWYHTANADILASVTVSVGGVYQPIVGDFDQNDGVASDDILWYSSSAGESLWSGLPDRRFAPRTLPDAPNNAKVLVGNFKPDATEALQDFFISDIIFYVPGTGADAIWTGSNNGGFTSAAITINGSYQPIVGNFHPDAPSWAGEALTDVFWYAPGTAQDSVWLNNNGAFVGRNVTVNGTSYKPFVIEGILGNDVIMWNNPTGSDSVWAPTANGTTWSYQVRPWPGADMGARTPLVGVFDEDWTQWSERTIEPSDVNTNAVPVEPVFEQQEFGRQDLLWFANGDGTGKTEEYWHGKGATLTWEVTGGVPVA